VAAKQTELAGELVFSLRYASLVVEWEELDHIDQLLAATRGRAAPRGAWNTSELSERATARV